MPRPDFGMARDAVVLGDRQIVVERKLVAPGLTLSDLVSIFQRATKAPSDLSHWPTVNGITAVTDAILNAVYGHD
jgi:hypothetical protein